MRSRRELSRHLLDHAYQLSASHLPRLTLEEALFLPPGGYRSILGMLKHAAAWSHVYQSFAFALDPRPWEALDWPRGQRDTIEPTRAYLDEVIAWFAAAHAAWQASLADANDTALDEPHPLHWGATAPLCDIVVMVASHHVYHAGEINLLLSLQRGEAWEEGEEVEENHIATVGHRVRPPWLT